MIYRIAFACYFLFSLTVSLIKADEMGELGYFGIFVSNWNLVLNAVASVCSVFILCPYFTEKIIEGQNKMPWSFQLYWFLVMLSPSVSFGISSVHWTIFDISDTDLNTFLTHAGNSIVLLLDVFINAYPARFGHFVYPMGLQIFYFFGFNLPYTLLGGVNEKNDNCVYDFVDWINRPNEALMNSLKFVMAAAVMQLSITALIKTRAFVARKIKN